MRYNIPTTTSNFNNILSTESVSPRAFYPLRKFGYSNFQPVPPNSADDVVLLYDKCPSFDLSDTYEEAYPLVVEIDTESFSPTSGFENAEFRSFYYGETIYLNPFETRFLFRNKSEMIATINGSARSIETKLTRLYSTSFAVIDSSTECFVWNDAFLEEVMSQIKESNASTLEQINHDIKVDRLKGMLYGLVIGANRSKDSKYYSNLLVLIGDLNNALSYLLNSRDNYFAGKQRKECEYLLNEINDRLIESKNTEINNAIIEHFRPCAKAILDRLGNKYPNEESRKNDEDIVIIEEICKQYERDSLYKKISEQKASHFRQKPFAGKSVLDLQNYINALKNSINNLFPSRRIKPSQLPLLENERIKSASSGNILFASLINGLLEKDNLAELIANSRYEFAHAGGAIFKELLGDDWNGKHRDYINSLLKNLNENTQFDISSTQNPLLKSFAALCKKGEKGELERFYDYLVTNGIADVKIAFALWGSVFGFACMPKTATNELFDDSEDLYMSEIYKYIHKQLFNEELNGELKFIELTGVPDLIPQEVRSQRRSIDVHVDTNVDVGTDVNSARPYNRTSALGYTREQLNPISITELKKIGSKHGLKSISKYKAEDKEKLVEMILDSNLSQTLLDIAETTDVAFRDSERDVEFYCDDRAFEYTKDLIHTEDGRKDLKEQIKWFQKTHKDGGYTKTSGERIVVNDHSNESSIEGLKRLLNSKYKEGRLKFGESEIEDVIACLKELYL